MTQPRCPECLKPVSGRTFCTAGHKAAFHNRQTVRGRKLTILKMAERITRGGSRGDTATGKMARRMADQLIQQWIEEDRAAVPRRMTAVEYLAQRWECGI